MTSATKSPTPLPDDPAVLKRIIAERDEEISHLHRQIDRLQQGLAALRRHIFGTKSERIPEGQMLFGFYGQVESEPKEPPPAPAKPPREKKGHGRRAIPPDLPREIVVHDVPEHEKTCGGCGGKLVEFARESSEQLEVTPPRLFALRHERPKYCCRACQGNVVVAPAATGPIERGLAGPGLLAYTMVAKYDDHLPCYRQSEMWRRQGVDLARSTMTSWIGQTVGLVKPIVGAMEKDVLGSRVIHTDDTPVRVLDPGQGRCHQGTMWGYVGDHDHFQVVYRFTWTRQQKHAKDFLGDWKGDLQADAYKGYDQLFVGGQIAEVACMAHVRRKFFEARDTDRERADWALGMIRRLYRVEAQAEEASAKERRRLRQRYARPVLQDLKSWWDCEVLRILPESAIGKAIQYARGLGPALGRYLEDGDLDIDNNEVERALRGIAIGRKNWLFLGSEGGGEWAAVAYSLIESCKMNGVNPFDYLKDVLVRVSTHPMSRIEELMPRLWKPPP
jgi:transposase